MTKHKTKRRSQKGGLFGYFEGTDTSIYGEKKPWYERWFGSSSSAYPSQTESFVNKVDTSIGNAATTSMNAVTDAVNMVQDKVTSSISSTDNSIDNSVPNSYGGKRKKHGKIKGGKGSLGLTYYANPISGIKVVEPDTWLLYKDGTNQCSIKGGSRKRRTQKRKLRKRTRTRRHKKKLNI
jgi:hypothetical protein